LKAWRVVLLMEHIPEGESMGDKNPKSKAKDQKRKDDTKEKAVQKAQAERDAKAVNNPKSKK
jgi:hypothetical protein